MAAKKKGAGSAGGGTGGKSATPDKSIAPTTGSPRALPRNPEALLVLLRAVEKLLDFLEPAHHGQAIRLKELQETLKEPSQIIGKERFLAAIAEANQNRFAQGGPSISAIVPYLDTAEVGQRLEKYRSACARLVPPVKAELGGLQAWQPSVAALSDVVANGEALLVLFRDLQQRILVALDVPEQADEDKKADRRTRLPKNPDVMRLAKCISDSADEEPSKLSIALQFTEGDEKQAQSLLRQLRRYPRLLGKRQF